VTSCSPSRTNVEGRQVAVGNTGLVEALPTTCPHADIHSTVGVAVDERYLGSLCLADRTREHAAGVITALRTVGVKRVILLTRCSLRSAGRRLARRRYRMMSHG
jgi:cation transport ATPase